MTSPALVKGLGSRLPSADERAVADHLRTVLAAQAKDGSTFRVMVGSERKATEITLTPALSDLFVEVLRHIGRGEAVTLVPVGKMLTTQQAADILNVSRPFLVSLLENGEIAHERVGRHRRVRAEDLFAYKEARAQRREKALSDLAAMDAQTL